MDADGTDRRMLELSPRSKAESQATWSADSSQLLVTVIVGGDTQLALLPVDGSPGRPITLPGRRGRFAWSPEETTIAAADSATGAAELIQVATGARTRQTRTADGGLAWQPRH